MWNRKPRALCNLLHLISSIMLFNTLTFIKVLNSRSKVFLDGSIVHNYKLRKMEKVNDRWLGFCTSFPSYNHCHLFWNQGRIKHLAIANLRETISRRLSRKCGLHWVTIKHIYLIPYVCNERIFGGLQFPINKIFWSKILITFVAH